MTGWKIGPGDACAGMAPLLEDALEGTLDEVSERRVRDHLAACSACREKGAALDPSVLFLELRSRPLPPAFWARFPEELRARLPEKGPRWAALFRHPGLAYVTTPAAVLLILVATLVAIRPGSVGWRGAQGIRLPSERPVPGPEMRPTAGRELPIPGAASLPPGAAGLASPVLEEVGSPGARVYRFTVGSPGDETPIYFVVDESIDI